MVTKKFQSPLDTPTSLDGDQHFSVAQKENSVAILPFQQLKIFNCDSWWGCVDGD
jgi:hypothetical protein